MRLSPEQDYTGRLTRLSEISLKDLSDMIDQNIEGYEAERLKSFYIEFILEYSLDIKDGFYDIPN